MFHLKKTKGRTQKKKKKDVRAHNKRLYSNIVTILTVNNLC